MSATPIEYRLASLEFRNGRPRDARKIGFARGRMLFNPADRIVAVDQLATPAAEIDRCVDAYAMQGGEPVEIMAIRYTIEIGGFPPLPMCHPLNAGAGVVLMPRERGQRPNTVFLRQREGRAFFSRGFNVGDVVDAGGAASRDRRVLELVRAIERGQVDASQPVFQFHGFRHEH